MNHQENINWDKVFKQLEGDPDQAVFNELNPEELEILLLAEETNMRLRGRTSAERFPVDAGWKELQDKHLEKEMSRKPQSIRKKLYMTFIAAASLICIAAPAWWLFNREEATNKLKPALAEVSLTLPNGEQVNVFKDQGILTEEGVVVNDNTLVYQKEADRLDQVKSGALNILEVPYGKHSHIVLSDGSSIWVNAGSKLSYPTVFPADKREVTLEGEAYFDISHNVARPFIVRTKKVNIRVLGTSFGINTFGRVTQTVLETGKVRLETDQKNISLKPGELGVFNEDEELLTKTTVDTRLYTAWKDQQIYFDNATMGEIATRLEREYNLEFVFESEMLEALHFTIDVGKTKDIKTLLDQIKFSHNQINFEVKDQKVFVKSR